MNSFEELYICVEGLFFLKLQMAICRTCDMIAFV